MRENVVFNEKIKSKEEWLRLNFSRNLSQNNKVTKESNR